MYKLKRKDFYLKIKEICDTNINSLLVTSDPARLFSCIKFYDFFSEISNFSFNDPIHIAIISGSKKEPELNFYKNAKVDLLNFSEQLNPGEYQYWDLNHDWSKNQYSAFHDKYDLVLCEQVFEHIPNPEIAIKNIKSILKPRGISHISVPSINGVHTDPYYFTAGYHKRMLSYLAKRVDGLEILECDSWGSKKAAQMYAICDWTPIVSSGDLIDCITISLRRFNFRKFIKYFYHKFKYNFGSIWAYENKDYPVIAWIILEKK